MVQLLFRMLLKRETRVRKPISWTGLDMPFWGWLAGRLIRLRQTFELHDRQLKKKLADQLRAANNQINELTANLRYSQDRAERAEKWLYQISSEIEQRFFGTNDSRPARRHSMR
jgi:hypothetical protein